MLECLIIGDSIAQGIANVRTECVDYAHGGWNSWQVNKKYKVQQLNAETVIISLGTNDHKYVHTEKELRSLRSRVHAKRVIWIMPANNNPKSQVSIIKIQTIVSSIAGDNHDFILDIPRPMADRYHPTGKGYRQLAKETK